MTIVT